MGLEGMRMSSANGPRKVIHQARSPFGSVYVVDIGDERTLRFGRPDGNRQSALLKSDPSAVPLSYARVATAALAFTEGRSHALVVGLGGGTVPSLLHRCLPDLVVDVVELNPAVVEVARRFFGLREDERLRIIVEDAARFMRQEAPCHYDFILLDAFSDGGTPRHLKEPPFLEDVRRRLAPGGVAVINIALDSSENKARLLETFAGVFESCARLRGPSESANLIAVGTSGPLPAEPVFRHQLWRLARELGFPDVTTSVGGFTPVPGGRAARRK